MKGGLPMARQLSFLVVILSLFMVRPTFGAEPTQPPLPARHAPHTDSSHNAETVKAVPINVLSIIPSQGEPGITVTLYGTGFTQDTTVFLGNMELHATVTGPRQLSFEIPTLSHGLYALYLMREDGTYSKPYNFSILPLKPIATSLSPDTIYACSNGRDREVTISGRNFQQGSQVMFDGAAIRSHFSSSESVTFVTPQVADGLHQIQVHNPEETLSGVLGLAIDGRPEISGVIQGEETVNHYNLIIDGRNFMQNSSLIVMEDRSIEQNNSQPSVDIKRISSLSANAVDREQIVYVNCNRIIYQRYPYSTTPKNFRLQVVNPGAGGESSLVSVSAP
jgi:IPT/TIG domain